MVARIPELPVESGTVRLVFPDGRKIRVRHESGSDVVRFAVEDATVTMTEFYGRSKRGSSDDAIVGLRVT